MITTKFYLDTRKTEPGKSALLKISITKDRTVSYLSTGIRLLPSDWDPAAQKAKSQAVQISAELKKANADAILLELQRNRKLDGLSAREVRDRILEEISPAERRPARLLETFRVYADQPKLKPRTKEIYLATVARILAFDPKAEAGVSRERHSNKIGTRCQTEPAEKGQQTTGTKRHNSSMSAGDHRTRVWKAPPSGETGEPP